ncbi:DUF6414 family protein [Photobacterium halotolerans]|uniref:Uncharacterized protein n=1 Tax=Photobacterium halotolerans TaxID=265726 RepID=A0A0F5VHU5_9GAMM|nr:hypothetical protein [Photobacterium halotolerans]KKD01412.1 hypothetical protein KY46_00860 [Photobacterium halotolerans]
MIKNLIYLNEEKLYSFSSQLFEGVTEFILNEETLEREDSENVKGRLASGKIIADVIKETSRSTKKKFLHDHSFNIFEKRLIDDKRILEVNDDTPYESVKFSISDYSFVRIKSKAFFSDANEIISVFDSFNELGEQIVKSQLRDENAIIEYKHLKSNIKDKDSAIEKEFLAQYNVKLKALEGSLRQPKIWKDSLIYMLNFTAKDTLQIHQSINEVLFTSILNPECLREDVTSLMKKYSRLTQKEFTILGLVSQEKINDTLPPPINIPDEDTGMRARLRAIAATLVGLDAISNGLSKNEVIVEPIAIYTEL